MSNQTIVLAHCEGMSKKGLSIARRRVERPAQRSPNPKGGSTAQIGTANSPQGGSAAVKTPKGGSTAQTGTANSPQGGSAAVKNTKGGSIARNDAAAVRNDSEDRPMTVTPGSGARATGP